MSYELLTKRLQFALTFGMSLEPFNALTTTQVWSLRDESLHVLCSLCAEYLTVLSVGFQTIDKRIEEV